MDTILRRALIGLFLLAVVWAAAVVVTGGFAFIVGSARFSSRHPQQAIGVAAVAAIALAALSWKPEGRRALAEDLWSLRFAPALLIALAGIAIDVGYWTVRPTLWLDEESIALNFRDRSFSELASPLWLGQSAPLGWLVLQRAVMLALGTGEVALRLVPVLFGIATVVAALVVGRRWLSPVTAAGFVLMCAFAPWLAHYRFEVKPYTVDAFCGLLLPALAVWAIEARDAAARVRRIVVWWAIAAATLWVANGAIFVAPACALFLVGVAWRRDGVRSAARAAAAGLIWLVSFGVYYQLSLQYTLKSRFLWLYWAEHLPPGQGVAATMRWLVERLQPLAANPAGTTLWVGFWIVAVCGLAFGSQPRYRALLAAIVFSVFLLAALGLYPFYERFVLWGVPGLYLAMILLVDNALLAGWGALLTRRWVPLVLATAVAVSAGWICTDIVKLGLHNARDRSGDYKHGLDDRAAVEWLMQQRQPGDAIVTTRLAWPAVWWYGGISLANFDSPNVQSPGVAAMYELTYQSEDCPSPAFQDVLKNHPRVLMYLGFRDVPEGFDELALTSFSKSGALTAYREIAVLSRAAVFDGRGVAEGSPSPVITRPVPESPPLTGCVGLRPMQRW